jgi:ABC-type antimicrobial peptide transport system permease subunit
MLVSIPVDISWALIAATVLLVAIVLSIGAVLIRKQIKKIDPNSVLRDNGDP